MINFKPFGKLSLLCGKAAVKAALIAVLDFVFAFFSVWLSAAIIYLPRGYDVIATIKSSPPVYLLLIAFLAALNPILFFVFGVFRIKRRGKALAALVLAILYALFSAASGINHEPGIFILYFFILYIFSAISRSAADFFIKTKGEQYSRRSTDRIMLVGVCEESEKLLRQINSETPVTRRGIVCIIDDNIKKHGMQICGVPVLGGLEQIALAAESYNTGEIIISAQSAAPEDWRDIVMDCAKTRAKLFILNAANCVSDCDKNNLREISIEDLLVHTPIIQKREHISEYIQGRRVLVTGGGGSIGSELCRQIAVCKPELLVALDIYENNIYELELELRRLFPELKFAVVIASIYDRESIDKTFLRYKPHIVFNSAAHKHVPLMESNASEAVKNNIFGTLNVLRASNSAGVERFVMISSDKAVRPKNVMGATKRVCEMLTQSYCRASKTRFSAVRFGNVLCTHGSVVPLFREQIRRGGPVQVTHPEITRYFMTVTEAALLVLEAGAIAEGGEIFVLDMGKPVKIDDLARSMIIFAGFEPDKEIKIEYIGLRPGEKLYEELLIDHEKVIKTENNLIFIEKPAQPNEMQLFTLLDRLKAALPEGDEEIKKVLCEHLPGYECDSFSCGFDLKETEG